MEESKKKDGKESYFLVSPNIVLITLVGLLLIFSVVQAFQISTVKSGMKAGKVLTTTAEVKSSGTASNLRSSAPAAPTMVGGC